MHYEAITFVDDLDVSHIDRHPFFFFTRTKKPTWIIQQFKINLQHTPTSRWIKKQPNQLQASMWQQDLFVDKK